MMRSAILLAAALMSLAAPPVMAQSAEPAVSQFARIGVVRPRVQLEGGQPAQVGEMIQTGIAGYLTGPTLEAAALQSRISSQIEAEASAMQCDYLLTLSLSHKRTSDGAKLGRAIGNFSALGSYLPGATPVESVIVTGAVMTASDLTASVQAKDELTLEFQLTDRATGAVVLKDQHRRRAGADGEDLLTPLIEAAAERVGEFVTSQVR